MTQVDVGATRGRVSEYLDRALGGASLQDGAFFLNYNGIPLIVNVGLFERTTDRSLHTVVRMIAATVFEVPASPELLIYLTDFQRSTIFGLVTLGEPDNDRFNVVFSHCLWGETLNFSAFEVALRQWIRCSVELSEEIRARFGGSVLAS